MTNTVVRPVTAIPARPTVPPKAKPSLDANALLIGFAAKHRLRIEYDECGDPVISGRLGQLYEYSSSELGVMIIPSGDPRPRLWRLIREKCLATGMTLRQNGDAEGTLSFDPTNRAQARLAIQVAKVRPKRQMSTERREAQLAILERARQARKNSIREMGSEAFFATEGEGTGEAMTTLNLAHETPIFIENPPTQSVHGQG